VNIRPYNYKQFNRRGDVDCEQCLTVSSRKIKYDVPVADEKNIVMFNKKNLGGILDLETEGSW